MGEKTARGRKQFVGTQEVHSQNAHVMFVYMYTFDMISNQLCVNLGGSKGKCA